MILRIGNKECSLLNAQYLGEYKKGKAFNLLFFLTTDRWKLITKKGLTLIEVMLAVSVLAIGIVGVLRAYATAITTLEAGQYNIDAVNLLKQKMAEVEQLTLEQGEEMLTKDSGNFDDQFTEFLWSWEIKPTETEYLNELELVVSHNYNPRTFSLKTYVVDPLEEEEQ